MVDKSEKDYIASIADNIGWITMFMLVIMLSMCTREPPQVNVTVDQCELEQEEPSISKGLP